MIYQHFRGVFFLFFCQTLARVCTCGEIPAMLTISYALWYKIYTDIVMRFLEYYYVVPHFRYTVYYFRFFGLYSGTWQQACGLRVCQEEGGGRVKVIARRGGV